MAMHVRTCMRLATRARASVHTQPRNGPTLGSNGWVGSFRDQLRYKCGAASGRNVKWSHQLLRSCINVCPVCQQKLGYRLVPLLQRQVQRRAPFAVGVVNSSTSLRHRRKWSTGDLAVRQSQHCTHDK